MEIKVIEKRVPSVDGIHNLYGKVYIPDCEIKGLFHLVHGMTEHIARYDAFLKSVAEEGYIAFAYNNLGHAITADDAELGFISKENGWKYLIADVKNYADVVRKEYGEKLPYYLMGHSMGSFIVRNAVVNGSNPDKLIVMGTGGPNPLSKIGLAVIKLTKKIKGEKYISSFVDNLAFGSYNKKFEKGNTYAWLTKDEGIRKIYASDKYCKFKFTVSAMQDLVTLQSKCNEKSWAKNVPTELPIILLSGKDDPVGDYGKGVESVYNTLKSSGKNAEIKLYENCRHEILNDTSREEVITDIKSFLKNN